MDKLYIKKENISITLIDEKDIDEKISNEITILENQKADKTNATQFSAGLMSAEDKIKLDEMDSLIGDINDYITS